MGQQIQGKLPPQYIGKPLPALQQRARIDNIAVDIKSYLNRPTLATNLKRYLQATDGKYDPRLWHPPLVAELPDGTLLLFDGDHRRALYCLAYPEHSHMPAQIIEVADLSEISRLFVAINKTGRTSLKPNELFVHEYLGGDEAAVTTVKNLRKCRLQVGLKTAEEGSVVGYEPGAAISIAGFKAAIEESGASSVSLASRELQKLWPNDTQLPVEFLRGLSLVYKNNASLSTKADHAEWFKEFLEITRDANGKIKTVSTMFKQEGGAVHNSHEPSIALGILIKFKKWWLHHSKASAPTFAKYYGEYMKSLRKTLDQGHSGA